MTAFEILLIIIGLILFVGSFFVSEKITASKEQLKVAIDEKEVKKLLESQIKDMDEELTQVVIENIENSTIDVKRSMEKLSNEKIMAIDEYATTVMESIHKNHNEVLFFYGMLNDKKKEIKETADLIANANKGINKKLAEALDVMEKMDSKILSINQNNSNQTNGFEKALLLEEQSIQKEKLLEEIPNDANSVEDYETFEDQLIEKKYIHKDIDVNTKDASNYNHIILEMSEEGKSAFDIAKNLGLGVGEVQLIIDLFKGGKR